MEYEYRPPRSNYSAHLFTLLFFLLSGASFAISGFAGKLSVLWQSLGVALLIPAIQIIGKYLVVQYLYRVHTCEDGSLDLDVYAYRGGTRMQLVCRVGLDEIKAVAPLSPSNRRAPGGIKRYRYCADFSPVRALVLSVENADGACEVLLSHDDRLMELLAAATPFFTQE